MTLISPRLRIGALHVDHRTCTGHLVVIGIVEMEGNTTPVCDADTLSINKAKTGLHRWPGRVAKRHRELSFSAKQFMRSDFQMRTSLSNKEHLVVGKDELIHQIAAKAGMNLKETNKVIDAFTEVVREGVAKGYEVRLMGFGTWNLRDV